MAPETPKGVSSRLLTMKFMQRAAASASSAGSPDSEVPSSKKRKLEHSPAHGRINPNIDQALIQAALDQEEATRQAALEKHSSTDTHWVLDNSWAKTKSARAAKNPLNVVYVGYGDFDSANESGDNEDAADKGRTSTRPPPKAEKKGAEKEESGDDSDEDGSEDQSSSDEDGPKRKRRNVQSGASTPTSQARSRSQSRSRQSLESAKAKELRDKRKKKEVRLNQLTSISGGGGTMSSNKSMKCYTCQQVGHKASDCPQRPQRRGMERSGAK
ncbi:Zinc finger domain-containing protein, CCHC-type [Purpureocillium lavendulum]|uniref:Zinc finger domain-containing protein, CCHC-type n=1 Tax=Purpureocillium lavendulum TaxID=1247861 RepID=A0AB34G5C6_9HYPO|nr:Zinc finger domain-containing protein, CCHC-type [Purpureocillium lavendulum]